MLKSMSARLTIVVIACMVSASALAMADTCKSVNVQAGALIDGLESLAHQCGVDVIYPSNELKGLTTRGVSGTLEPKEAFRKLIEGTPLILKEQGSAILIALPGSSAKTLSSTSPDAAGASEPAQEEKKSSGGFRVAQVDQASVGPQVNDQGREKKRTPEILEEVVVTGTYLHDTAPVTPVTTITHDEIIRQGYTRLDDLIFQLPQEFQGGSSPASNPVNGFGNGAAYNYTYASGINLRGLGAGATLVLLNGHRLAPTANGGVVDVSQTPVSIIDRVEILTDGASALYGSDAVAGVVNIITRKGFTGIELGARSSDISEGKTPNYGGDVVGGTDWGAGGVVASVDYEKDNPLYARNRPFSQTLADPTFLTPKNEATHLYLSLHNAFTERLTLSLDALVTQRKYETESATVSVPPYTSTGDVKQYNSAAELDYALSEKWTATLVGSFAREQDRDQDTYPSFGELVVEPVAYNQSAVEPRIDGQLFSIPGGAVRLALGGQMRWESIKYNQTVIPFGVGDINAEKSRHVTSAYGELLVPIVGADNAVSFVRRLRFDVSGRFDDYSDFGRTSNPKIAVDWAPIDDLTFHSSYARSFQAPTPL